MKWIFDNLQVVIVIAGVIAWWLNQRRAAQAGDDEPRPEKTFDDPELAERTRKIREEIQRKIEQRARGYTQPTASPTEPPVLRGEDPSPEATTLPPILPDLLREVMRSRVESSSTPAARAAAERLQAQRQAEILEQQAALAEQLQQAREMKAAATRRVAFEDANADKETAVLAKTRTTVLGDLRDPATLRRAFILREVLGPPVALR